MNKEQLREQDANKANATALGWDKALAQEKANQEKIGATVQAARASATQPTQSLNWSPIAESDRDKVKRLQAQRDDLQKRNNNLQFMVKHAQAQRDELLVLVEQFRDYVASTHPQCKLAKDLAGIVAKATKGQGSPRWVCRICGNEAKLVSGQWACSHCATEGGTGQ